MWTACLHESNNQGLVVRQLLRAHSRLPHGIPLLDHIYHLIQSFSPAVAEAHFVVSFSAGFIAMDGNGRILGFPALRLHQDNRSEKEELPATFCLLNRPVSGKEGGRKHQLLGRLTVKGLWPDHPSRSNVAEPLNNKQKPAGTW
jgi:hypothetical protein